MSKFKYVKFSRGTAKSNPNMIIREYDRVIYENKKCIDCLSEVQEVIEIDDWRTDFSRLRSAYDERQQLSSITVTFCELEALYLIAKTKYKKSLDIRDTIKNIEKEKALFIKKYG